MAAFLVERAVSKAHLIRRSEVVVLRLSSADDAAAKTEMRRQLPPDVAGGDWLRSADQVALWPAAQRRKAESRYSKHSIEREGARLAAGILPGGAAWMVAPRRWSNTRIGDWKPGWERFLVAATAALALIGLGLERISRTAEEHLFNAERERARLTAAAGQDRLPFFVHLGAAIPGGAHLTSVSLDEDTRSVRLRGRAVDYAAVSAVTAGLAASPGIESVQPGTSTLAQRGGRTLVEFDLEARLR